MKAHGLNPRIRKSPFFASSLKYGATEFHPYTGMWMPVGYDTPVNEYWNTIERAGLWDVAVQRCVQIAGPDAEAFTNLADVARRQQVEKVLGIGAGDFDAALHADVPQAGAFDRIPVLVDRGVVTHRHPHTVVGVKLGRAVLQAGIEIGRLANSRIQSVGFHAGLPLPEKGR